MVKELSGNFILITSLKREKCSDKLINLWASVSLKM